MWRWGTLWLTVLLMATKRALRRPGRPARRRPPAAPARRGARRRSAGRSVERLDVGAGHDQHVAGEQRAHVEEAERHRRRRARRGPGRSPATIEQNAQAATSRRLGRRRCRERPMCVECATLPWTRGDLGPVPSGPSPVPGSSGGAQRHARPLRTDRAAPHADAGAQQLDPAPWCCGSCPRHVQRVGRLLRPGTDPYSDRARRAGASGPGAIDARITDFLLNAADFFVPLPDGFARAVVSALRTGSRDTGFPIPPELLGPVLDLARMVDDEIVSLLDQRRDHPAVDRVRVDDQLLATRVNPAAINGAFLSPFSRLTWAEKAKAWEMFEDADPDLVAAIDSEPARARDRDRVGRAARSRPAPCSSSAASARTASTPRSTRGDAQADRPNRSAMRISKYTPAAAGWDDFKGYWKGRKEADR